ncbi:hypothetical protein ACN27E_09565 [Mycobacterium sp. WMMD1722]|uniref:hypothetical protein n=1 Tax=Mycobacterium sp. WMMD1722 TaxID=3404117 RepID=UPI003BF59376
MNTVLYASPNGVIYETRAYSKAEIAELIDDHGLENLSSRDRQYDFWFTPSTRRCRKINRRAIELLLVTTGYTARTVPLLRGAVVVATHDADGDLDGLSWQQLDALAEASRTLSKRELRVLERRIARAERTLRRPVKPAASAIPAAEGVIKLPVRH